MHNFCLPEKLQKAQPLALSQSSFKITFLLWTNNTSDQHNQISASKLVEIISKNSFSVHKTWRSYNAETLCHETCILLTFQ